MTFSTHEQYLADREDLCKRMEDAASADDSALFDQLDVEVKALDNGWEEYKVKMANVAAIKKEAKPMADVITAVTESMTDGMEARKDFMNYVRTGKITNNVTTTNAGAAVPTELVNRIVGRMEANSMIIAEVTRTAYKGGVTIPAINLKPVATFVAEGAGSTAQTLSLTPVTFAYHKLRCSVPVSLEMDVMSIDAFEDALVEAIAAAMVATLEKAIVQGSGTGEPEGILHTAAPSGQAMTSVTFNYATLVSAEGKLPIEYEANAKWCMSKAQFMEIEGIVDTAGQPIARVNYGLGGKPERYILGRPVVLVPASYMASAGVDAFIFDFKDYVLNTNYGVTMKKYEDNATDDQVTKAVMLVDGKKVDNGSLVTLAK